MTKMFGLQGFFARHLPPMSHRISVGGLAPADLEVVERPEVAAGLLQAVKEMVGAEPPRICRCSCRLGAFAPTRFAVRSGFGKEIRTAC
jgi:hypothetical protein